MFNAELHLPIWYTFQNIQKSQKTMHNLLETMKNSVYFLFIEKNPVNFVQALLNFCHLPPELAGTNISLAANLAWNKHSKLLCIDSNPNSWWTDDCQLAKDMFLLHCSCSNLTKYNAATRTAHQNYFLRKIELMTENNAPWEGIRWMKPHPPPNYSTIMNDGAPIPDMATLFNTMHAHFSSAANNNVSEDFLASIPQVPPCEWSRVSTHEINEMLSLTSNMSAPGPDHIMWHHLKQILSSDDVANTVCLLFNNVCSSGVWPTWFKDLLSVII
ncbi:hypothetical protein AX14_007092 [Amanita brunnescens Koide BX004]|nr:hypothetical protein AX14_007092 [Amanita brunnescens Koide BX004]